jgi:uncharacterized protein YcbX
MDVKKVSDIIIYPVKSCKGIQQEKLFIGTKGPHMDRRWMVVDENGTFLSQRTLPQLAMVHTGLDARYLFLSVPGMSPCMLPQKPEGPECEVSIWNSTCKAYDMGGDVATWLTAFLQRPARLVFLPEDQKHSIKPEHSAVTEVEMGFADRLPILLISEASLSELNSRSNIRLRMNRFRPNIVVSGCTPFEEDSWKRIRIGEVVFSVEQGCARSVIPTINQETVQKDAELLKELATFRTKDNSIVFGQLLVHENTGHIQRGMEVEILD